MKQTQRPDPTPTFCPICGNLILSNSGTLLSINQELNKYVLICDNCETRYGYSCTTCKYEQPPAPECLMQKYHGPLDVVKMVHVKQQLGSAIVEQVVPQINPEVISQVCKDCKCGDTLNCQVNCYCNNWTPKEVLKKNVISAQQKNK